MFQLCCQAKVTYLDPHLLVKEQVAKLQVPVNDPPSVQILESHDEIVNVKHCLWF